LDKAKNERKRGYINTKISNLDPLLHPIHHIHNNPGFEQPNASAPRANRTTESNSKSSITMPTTTTTREHITKRRTPKTPSTPPPEKPPTSTSSSTQTRPGPTQDLDLLPTYTSTVSCACILDPETSPRTSTALLFLLILDPAGLRINNATTHLYEIHPARKYPRHITSDAPGGQSLARLPPLTHLGSVEWDMEGDLLDVVDEAVYEVVRLRREEGDEDVGTFVRRFVRVMGELGWEW
jgi:hypothetical protein